MSKAALRRLRDPVWFAEHALGVSLWDKQKDVLRAFASNRITSVRSCHGAGKSFLSACAATWFLPVHYQSKLISTAPTNRQVKTILWSEIRQLVANSKADIGPPPKTQHWELGPNWFGMGFTAPDYAPDKFQGQHARGGLAAIVDESSGVADKIYDEGVEPILTGDSRALFIGNPTNPSGFFAKSFKQSDVAKIKISAFDTPNFTEFGIKQEHIEDGSWADMITGPLPRPYLITPDWVARVWSRWNRDKNDLRYRSRVLADFPVLATDALIGLDLIEAAQNRELEAKKSDIKTLGVDVASFGGDSSCIAFRHGSKVRIIWRTPNTLIPEVAARVKYELLRTGAEYANIDISGVGRGVFDILILDPQVKKKVRSFTAAGKPDEPDRFAQRRDEAMWIVREAFVNGEIDIDSTDEELADEIAPIRWKLLPNGKIKVMSKDEMKRLGLGSPDSFDAVCYAFHSGDPHREFVFIY